MMRITMETTEKKTVTALKAHLALNVKNVARSIEFYQKMLGIEPSKVRTGYAKFDVQNPPLNLTLNEVQFKERGALSHLGIQVASTDDVLAMREKWAEAGLVTRDEMQTNCCYATQDKTWVRDPDGNEWEAFVVLKDNLAETAPCECGNKVTEAQGEAETVGAACAVSTSSATASCCGATLPMVEASSCCETTASTLVSLSR
jgi:catechol 2,3-dioxygenase-like lactoylglutathione lyase family enzyme